MPTNASLRETTPASVSLRESLPERMPPREVPRASTSPCETGQSQPDAAAELAALRAELLDPASDVEGPSVLKRPASKSQVMKKPGAATGSAGSKKLHACKTASSKKSSGKVAGIKKPAAAVPPKGRALTAASKDLRDRLLASIPSELKRAYKNGCSSCRHRPYCCNSCWIKRGFSIGVS